MQSQFSRRSFLAGSASLAGAMIPGIASSKTVSSTMPDKWDKTFDVVVFGSGGAGMHAAIQASDLGGSVVICDKSKSPFHSATCMNAGVFTAYNSHLQREKNVRDSIEQVMNDIISYGNYYSNPDIVRTFAQYSGQTFDWMAAHGLKANDLEAWAGHTNLRAVRQRSISGRDYIEVLDGEIKKRPIEVHRQCELRRLFYDRSLNRVVGAEVAEKGKTFTIAARRGVVLATGGIMGTPESADKWLPSLRKKGVVVSCSANDGNAMEIAVRDVGVPLTHMQFCASYPTGIVVNGRNGNVCRFFFLVNCGALLVNKLGKRYVSEQKGVVSITPHLLQQPDGTHWVLMDDGVWQEAMKRYPTEHQIFGWTKKRVEDEFSKNKVFFRADTLEECAEAAGVDPVGLAEQVKLWNEAVESKKDLQFGRTLFTGKLEKGPWRMLRLNTWNIISCGGFRVNAEMQVLGYQDQPVGGLWAAGETVGAVHGNCYLGGDANGFAQTSGFLVGHLVMGDRSLKPAPETI